MSDIEHLKVNKLAPRPDGRVGLPTVGQPAEPSRPSEEESEAYGGSGQAPTTPVNVDALRETIVVALKSVYDPEIPLNIYDLGLIYGLDIDEQANVEVHMTLTAPGCPVAGMLVREVARKVGEVNGVNISHVQLVWDPPWTKDRMSDEALLELGLI